MKGEINSMNQKMCNKCGAVVDINSGVCPACGSAEFSAINYDQQQYGQYAGQYQQYDQQQYNQQYNQQQYNQQYNQQYAQQYNQQQYNQQYNQQYAQQPYMQQPVQQPKKKGGKGLLIGIIAALVAVVALVAVLVLGKGDKGNAPADNGGNTNISDNANAGDKDDKNNNNKDDNTGPNAATAPEKEDKPTIKGTDVFGGEHYNEVVWGYYTEETYKYTGSKDDTLTFRKDMKYKTYELVNGDYELSVLPLYMQAGKYTHFMGPFVYENEYYYAYTEKGRANFRKAYMAQKGDLTEEDFAKIEKILNIDVMEVELVTEEGGGRINTFIYEIKGNKLSLYEFDIKDNYDLQISKKPVVEYEFLHDGGKLTLAYDGVQRSYLTQGYKTEDYLSVAGYALNQNNIYNNLLGLDIYKPKNENTFETSLYFANGDYVREADMDLDIKTGKFTVKWNTIETTNEFGKRLEREQPGELSATFIPLTSYGFTDYCGFILIADGKHYHYLMTEEEFAELNKESTSGNENLNATKTNILAELEKAFKDKGINVTVDYTTAKITLESNFLFGTDSYELSADGKAYLDAFTDVYTSVVLSDKYSAYISGIVVEGHTDTNGNYKYNQTLSQKRADAVSSHCINRNSKIAGYMQSIGCSYDYPVYNNDGTVNMAASRRVTFRFMFNGN